jgi:hypothetical protein
MNDLLSMIGCIAALGLWFAGVALAKGFWSTTIAVFFFPYAWYLVVERLMFSIGWL